MVVILTDGIFKRIFLNENGRIPMEISVQFVPIENKAALLRVMAWRRPCGKPLPEPMMTQRQCIVGMYEKKDFGEFRATMII